MTPETIWRWAQLKGITVIGTGDFTHPAWFRELSEKLEPCGNGLFRLRKEHLPEPVFESCRADVLFMLSAEVSSIYRKGEKTRKAHSLLYAPDFAAAERINRSLSRIGNLSADGRPILGLDAKELLRIVLDASPEAMFVPAHAWTPHFSVFGAESGFDSLVECFDELAPHVRAIETGLSSDPPMNWRLSALDRVTLISNSDSHSPQKIGREANIFDTEFSYSAIRSAIETRQGLAGTVEFFPEEGKYHHDGHRPCEARLTPEETVRHAYRCPVCGKRVTVGVMHRVERLADRAVGFRPPAAPGYQSVIPLVEIIAETLKKGAGTKAVAEVYDDLLQRLGSEFRILLDVPVEEITLAGQPSIADAIARVRAGHVNIAPGYDGEYGKIRIFEEVEKTEKRGQETLF